MSDALSWRISSKEFPETGSYSPLVAFSVITPSKVEGVLDATEIRYQVNLGKECQRKVPQQYVENIWDNMERAWDALRHTAMYREIEYYNPCIR